MNFFYKESKSKKKSFEGMRGDEVGGRGRWTDRRTGLNQLFHSTSAKLGA